MIFKISDEGTARIVGERLMESGARAMETNPVMQAIVRDIRQITEMNFRMGGRRGGGSWKKLAESTIRKKGHARILRDTDALYKSVTEEDAPYQILKWEYGGFQFGTDRPWAYTHQRGSGDGHVPRRPFLRFLPYDERKWRDMIAGHILKPFTRTDDFPGPIRGR